MGGQRNPTAGYELARDLADAGTPIRRDAKKVAVLQWAS
jgi:hypothetical protein